MNRNLDDIRNLIRSRFKAKNISIPDKELERLTRKYGRTDYNLLLIKDQVDLITMMIQANENKSLFNSEDIGDHLAALNLKQMDINEAGKTLNFFVKQYIKENRIEIDPMKIPYKKEKRVLFMSEEIGDTLAKMNLNQHRINDAEMYLRQLTKSSKASDDLKNEGASN